MNRFDKTGLKEFLPYSRPSLDDRDVQAVLDVLSGTIISQGDVLLSLETAWREMTGADYAFAYSTGSSALHGMCFAAGLGEGDEVILPALTFASTANAVLHVGARPVFADVDPETFCLDPDHVRKLVTSTTRAIIAVDFAGRPCDYNALRRIADENGLMLLADAAHAAGASYKTTPIGGVADMTAFSFNPVKNITAGEGGMVVGFRDEARASLDMFRTHGMTRKPDQLLDPPPAGWYYEQQSLGFNYKLSELHAALGLSQLAKLGIYNQKRRKLALRYQALLADLPLDLPNDDNTGRHAWHLFVVRIRPGADVSRNEVFEELRKRNVGVQLHYIPVPMHPYYRKMGYSMNGLDVTRDYFERAFSLPLHPGVTEDDQLAVASCLRGLLR